MKSNKFKNQQQTWAYLVDCSDITCSGCGEELYDYVEKKKDDDSVDFHDLATCYCGHDRFNGTYIGDISIFKRK
ncbi:hypothetical protein [Proteus columbae]|uniref:hypothetical protein n=1 Tax=Proteus columbae TaxID=1987580 RepID=UPI00288B6A35|nr:hypothetical protein [Proteus columbae]